MKILGNAKIIIDKKGNLISKENEYIDLDTKEKENAYLQVFCELLLKIKDFGQEKQAWHLNKL